MTDFTVRYDRWADVLYLNTSENAPALAREDDCGIVWRYRIEDERLVGATIIDFHELWDDRISDLADRLAVGFHVPWQDARAALLAAS